MSDFEESGLNARHFEPLQYTFQAALGRHISTSAYLVSCAGGGALFGESETFHHNNTLWDAAITAKRLHHGLTIRLDSFFLFEWIPRAPGLYWTPEARHARADAKQRIIKIDKGRVIYSPDGKQSMLDGGVGNIRLRPVLIQGREFMFMSASANGICHQGFPVAVPLDIYGRCIEQIRERGAVVRTLTGQIKIIPKEIADIYAGYVNVPKLYLQVEEAELPSQRKSRTVEDLEISVAVSFQGVVDDKSGIYATYATFDPSNPMSFSEAIDWMRDEYVRSYKGIILTDFDEHENHFSEARFSLKKVMQLDLEAQDFKVLNIGSVDKFISFQQTIREQTNYNVAGGNIGALGDGATATNFTQLAKPHRSVPNRKPSKGRRL